MKIQDLLQRIKEWGHDEIKTFLTVTLGCILFAMAVTLFVAPARLPASGVTGISLLLNYLWGVPLGLSTLVLNVGLFVYAFKALNRRFWYWSLYATVLLSAAFELTALLPVPVIQDRLLQVILAGVLEGASMAMVFSVGASTGGTDIITMAVKRYTGKELGSITMLVNFAVLALFCFILNIEQLLYGVLMTYIKGAVMNSDIRAFGIRKEAMIITTKIDEVKHFIITELHRGVTIFPARGGFCDTPREVMITMLSPRQALYLKMFLRKTDPKAFLRLADVSEVLGRGFGDLTHEV